MLAKRYGLKTSFKGAKHFVLDTNVLLHDPQCLERFGDNHLCILVDVLAELDRFKSEQSDRGSNARRVHRRLSELFSQTDTVTQGVKTQGGGSLRLVIYEPWAWRGKESALEAFLRIFPDQESVDHRIMAATLLIAEQHKEPVILVTKDLNMQLKARAVGIACQDYLNDKVEVSAMHQEGIPILKMSSTRLQRFASSGELALGKEYLKGLRTNAYVLLSDEKKQLPARLYADNLLRRLAIPELLRIPDGQELRPLNDGQKCLIDALLDPAISLVTCFGQAGTGKTLVAVAAGLHEMFNRHYQGLTISRPVIAMGDQLGFLPGGLEEKMKPWLAPIYDALDFLMCPDFSNQVPRRKVMRAEGNSPMSKPYDALLKRGIVEIEALCYIRGRSIPRRFFILDEAQQLTPQEAKTVVTRMSRGSKLVLVGDPAQIDNPYVDRRSNGLVFTYNRLRGEPFAAHITLTSGERSPLSEAGAQLM